MFEDAVSVYLSISLCVWLLFWNLQRVYLAVSHLFFEILIWNFLCKFVLSRSKTLACQLTLKLAQFANAKNWTFVDSSFVFQNIGTNIFVQCIVTVGLVAGWVANVYIWPGSQNWPKRPKKRPKIKLCPIVLKLYKNLPLIMGSVPWKNGAEISIRTAVIAFFVFAS